MPTPRFSKSKKSRAGVKEPEFKHRPISDIEKIGSETESRCRERSPSFINSVLGLNVNSLSKRDSPNRSQTVRPPDVSTSLANRIAQGPQTLSMDSTRSGFAVAHMQANSQELELFDHTMFRSHSHPRKKHHEPSPRPNANLMKRFKETAARSTLTQEMAKNFGKKYGKGKGKGPGKPPPATITPPTSSPERPPSDNMALTRPPLPRVNQWGNNRPQMQRGDVQRPTARRPLSLLQAENLEVLPEEKVHILKICLVLGKQYLDQPSSESYSEHPFWTEVFRLLDSHPLTQAKFPMVQTLKQKVSRWCEERRHLLVRGDLYPVGTDRDELEVAIDEWNKIWAKRYSKIYKAAFILDPWPTIEDQVKSFIQKSLHDLANRALEKRMEELRTLIRPPLLRRDSTQEDYYKYLGYLQQRLKGDGPDSLQIRESEAVMSLIADLQPGLGEEIGRCMRVMEYETNQEDSVRDSASTQEEHDDGGDVNMTVVSSIEPHMPTTESDISCQEREEALEEERRYSLPAAMSNHNQSHKKRKAPSDDDELDTDVGTRPKQPRVSARIDSPESVASTWSFPSISELMIKRRASPPKTPTRQPASTSAKPSPRMETSDDQRESQRQPRRQKAKTPVQSSQPDRPITSVSDATRPKLSTPDSGSGTRTGHSRAAKLGSSQQWEEHSEYAPQSAGQSEENRAIAAAPSLRVRDVFRDSDLSSTSRWFRENTCEFQEMGQQDKIDMLYRALKTFVNPQPE